MKKQAAFIFQRQYLPLLIAVTVAATLAGRVRAAVEVGDISDSAGMDAASGLPAWNVPFEPASQDFMEGLGDFLFNHGEAVYKQAPELRLLNDERLTPESRRRIVGALGFSNEAGNALVEAIHNHNLNRATLDAVGTTILNAYRRSNFKDKLTQTIDARADEIGKNAKKNGMSPVQLSAAASELEPFASISEKADITASALVLAARAKTKDEARKILSEFIGNDPAIDGVSMAADSNPGQRDQPQARGLKLKPVVLQRVPPREALRVPKLTDGETINLDTMARLVKGYDVLRAVNGDITRLKGRYAGSIADAALWHDMAGQKFRVKGILKIYTTEDRRFKDEPAREMNISVNLERAGGYVFVDNHRFSSYLSYFGIGDTEIQRRAKKYLESLPANGSEVVIDFAVTTPGMNSGPFQVESIRSADGTASLAESKSADQKSSLFRWGDMLSGALFFAVIIGGAGLIGKGFVGTGVLLILAYFGYLLVSAGGPAESDYPPYTKP